MKAEELYQQVALKHYQEYQADPTAYHKLWSAFLSGNTLAEHVGLEGHKTMTNLLKQAINCDDADRAAKIIQDALGIESSELANLCLKHWPSEREKRARVIGHWLHAEAQFLD